jgi:hypothetical protein
METSSQPRQPEHPAPRLEAGGHILRTTDELATYYREHLSALFPRQFPDADEIRAEVARRTEGLRGDEPDLCGRVLDAYWALGRRGYPAALVQKILTAMGFEILFEGKTAVAVLHRPTGNVHALDRGTGNARIVPLHVYALERDGR